MTKACGRPRNGKPIGEQFIGAWLYKVPEAGILEFLGEFLVDVM